MLFPFLQQSCIKNTVMLPSTGRSKGSKEKSQARKRKGSGRTRQLGPHLHPICLHLAPLGHHVVLLLHCGRTSLMFEAVASWTTSATRRGNYRRWWCHFTYSTCWYVLSCTRLADIVPFLPQAKFELVTSEASYIRSLTIAVDHFMLSQELAECLGTQDKQWLFSKLPEVKDVSERWSNMLMTFLYVSPKVLMLPSLCDSAYLLLVDFCRTWSTGWRKTFSDLTCATLSYITVQLCEGFICHM